MTNKTSEAVTEQLNFATYTKQVERRVPIGILEKYKRMEEALVSISYSCQGTSIPVTRILNCLLAADDALAFDPLNSSSPNSL